MWSSAASPKKAAHTSMFGIDDMALGALGALGSSSLSAASSALNSVISYGLNKKIARYNAGLQLQNQQALMDKQYGQNQQSLIDSPSNSKEGLIKAGFNPMLAITSATNAPTVGLGSAGMPSSNGEYGLGDLGSAFDRGANSALQRREQKKRIEKMDKLTDAELEKLQAESQAAMANSGAAMYDAETKRMEANARIEKIQKETESISPAARYGGDWIKDVKDVAAPFASGFGAYQGAKVASKMMAKAGIRDSVPYARAATSSAVANSAKGAVLIGSRYVPGVALAVGAGWLGKKSQDSARKNNTSSWRSYRSYTHHLSAGW